LFVGTRLVWFLIAHCLRRSQPTKMAFAAASRTLLLLATSTPHGCSRDHDLITLQWAAVSFPTDKDGFCSCLKNPASPCNLNAARLFARSYLTTLQWAAVLSTFWASGSWVRFLFM
jgi:hypothetical protein